MRPGNSVFLNSLATITILTLHPPQDDFCPLPQSQLFLAKDSSIPQEKQHPY